MGFPHIWPELVRMVVMAPRTMQELAELMGTKEETVRKNLKLLEFQGLVKRTKANGRARSVWTWTP